MQTYYLKFGLGGVQEFISQARKVRDLVAGSELIADLVKAAGEFALSRATLLLPTEPKSGESWPHQFVVEIRDVDDEYVRGFGKDLVDKVSEAWKTSAVAAHGKYNTMTNAVGISDEDGFVKEAALSLEPYWVATPLGTKSPQEAFMEVAALYDDRRYTRTFAQIPAPAKERWVCTLCGQRASAIPRATRKPSRLLGDGELLCAACLTKRHRSMDKQSSTHTFARHRFRTDPIFNDVRTRIGNIETFLDAIDELDAVSAVAVEETNAFEQVDETSLQPVSAPVEKCAGGGLKVQHP
ncbi:MAG TPA: type III-B CRISPR-associated protein Cas10/Cmr2, partial [Candidatus Hydrogenedentes bacterium]|nr:type III-B CRISPR-associated protein Cas10/Cmr2 [Candidatus Hydrogenedentota bacterium]